MDHNSLYAITICKRTTLWMQSGWRTDRWSGVQLQFRENVLVRHQSGESRHLLRYDRLFGKSYKCQKNRVRRWVWTWTCYNNTLSVTFYGAYFLFITQKL